MCGICGYYYVNGNVNPDLIKKMTDSLIHRGPDEEGYFKSKRACLGHRRLSIIDLKSGQQPIYNENKSKVIIFNGEIYNYKEIRNKLLYQNHKFSTNSDTETILHLYEEMGPDCVKELRGMFAFIIYDKNNHTLFAARDRLGIKPLYYSFDNGRFFFGSEIKALLASKKVEKKINLESLHNYMTYLYIPTPESIFSSIKKLPAGHTLLLQNGLLSINQYWDIDFSKTEELSESDWIDKIRTSIKESVKMRMISEVPLGGFLSGGVDSSYIIGLMSKHSNTPVITNSIGFKEAQFNELEYARKTSKLFNTTHHEDTVDLNCSKTLDLLAWYYDEPFADSSALPTYYVSKMTKRNVTVALSGDGGDENFVGYRRYFFDVLENRIRSKIPNVLRKTLIRAMAEVYPKADWLPQIFRAKTLLTNLSINPAEGYFNSMSHLYPSINKIFNKEILAKLNGYSSYNIFLNHYNRANTNDLLSRIQYVDIKTYLVDDILTKIDRASMANSLEVRVPLLDHKFMECIATIPSSLKLKSKIRKYIFKETTKDLLPEQILNRKKMGFSIPIDLWFRNRLKPIVEKEVLINNTYSEQFFNQKKLRTMWNEHQKGIKNYGTQFWAILMFEKWAKIYL